MGDKTENLCNFPNGLDIVNEVKSVGKDVFDIGKTYWLTAYIKGDNGRVRFDYIKDGAIKYKMGNIAADGLSQAYITVTAEMSHISACVQAFGGTFKATQIMLSEGSEPLPYEPYGYKISILSGEKITNIYTDKPLYSNDKLVYPDKRINKTGVLILDGSQLFDAGVIQTGDFYRITSKPNAVPMERALINQANLFSTHFVKGMFGTKICVSNYFAQIVITMDKKSLGLDESDTVALQNFLNYFESEYIKGTPVTIYYPLAEETTESVELPEISTLSGNNVLNIGTEVQPTSMKIKYRTDYHKTIVYGYHIDPNEADSSAAVTYLADAAGMTPAAMGTDSFDYGSWKNAFFMPKPCMLKYDGTVAYYLDPNDYSRKLDGTPSDIANADFEGNAMMEWGLIWYKFVGGTEDGEGYFYVANKQIDDSYHCWCNYDANNNIIPHFYTAIYNSTLHNGKFRSLSGLALTRENGSGYTTGVQEITYCTANNTTDTVEWYTGVYTDVILINALHVLISKSINTQASFGRGLDSGSEAAKNAYVTGALNDKGLFYGVTANGNSGVKTFGMENWWGCQWHRVAGCIAAAYDYKIKLTYGTADGTTVNDYNSTGEGYISTGTTPSANGYVKKFKYGEKGYMPFEVGGSASTYYADYYYQSTATYYLLTGGGAAAGATAGAFCFRLSTVFAASGWSVSAALSCKPHVLKNNILEVKNEY